MKKINKNSAKKWILVSLIFLFLTDAVFAEIRLGRLKVEPEIAYVIEYNNNIFLENTNRQHDVIHTVRPGVMVKYEGATPDNYVRGGYIANLTAYSSFHDNNWISHNPFFSAGIKTPIGLYAKADDQFMHTSDPFGTENSYREGKKTKRWNNTFSLLGGYQFAQKFSIEGQYQNYLERFYEDTDKWQNRIDHQIGLAFFYKITGKTSFFGQYRHTVADYDKQNDGASGWTSSTSQDYSLNDFFVGIRFDSGGKLSGEIKAGYGTKQFDNDQDKSSRPYKNQNSWVSETKLDYHMLERTTLSFNLQRTLKGSPDEDSSSYLDTLMELGIRQVIKENRMSLRAGLSWESMDYSQENLASPRKFFNIYTAKVGFDWQFVKWFTGMIEYQYKAKNPSEEKYADQGYRDNVFVLSLNAKF